MLQAAVTKLVYQLKTSPYSSHSLLLQSLPEQGQGRRVLDVGCAQGYLAGILADRGYDVVGIERPEGAGENFPANVDLIKADLEQELPRLSGTFAFIICADILEHLRDPLRLLRDLRQYLQADGRLIASLPNSGNAYFRLNIMLGRFPRHDKGLFDRTHLHFYTWSGWYELFSSGGFQIEKMMPTGIPLGLAVPRWEDNAVIRLFERLLYESARLWTRMFAYQFVVTARQKSPDELH
jgi:SAM-dependent methyltransferase